MADYSDAEIKRLIKQVVSESKSDARVDTGFLKRSIRGNWFQGIATFREVYYGAYNDNSSLLENAQRIMPKEVPWRLIFVDEEGREQKVEATTRTGRKVGTKTISSRNRSTDKIKALISAIRANGKKNNDTREGDSSDDN